MEKKPEQLETATEKVRAAQKEKPDGASELYFWAQALAFALAFLVLVNTFFFRLSGVHGSSMYDTLEDGDQLILQVIGYHEPQRGDIIVCTSDAFGGEALVKRVIAVEGDTLDIDGSGNVVLNGETLYGPYIYELIRSEKRGNQRYPVTVDEGCIFVMGDNRNGSTDSRYTEVGQISCQRVIGKALFRIWPLNKLGGVS